jgi:hypothetical protein
LAIGCGSAYDDEEVRDARSAQAYAAPAAGLEPGTIVVVQCPAVGEPCTPAAPAAVVLAPSPVVVAAPPPVVTPVDPAVAAEMRKRSRKFERCYRKGLRHNPALAGTVVVRMQVDDDGEVEKAYDQGSTLPDRDVVDCVVGEAEDADFKHSVGSVVTYPLHFQPDRLSPY